MHIQHDESTHQDALQLGQVQPDQINTVLLLLVGEGNISLHGLGIAGFHLIQGLLSTAGPHDLIHRQSRLGGEGSKEPILSDDAILWVCTHCCLGHGMKAFHHALFDITQPLLHRASRGLHGSGEGHLFFDHVIRVDDVLLLFLGKGDETDGIETFAEVLLDSLWIPGLRHDAQQLVVRQEVETREGSPLRLQVSLEALLDLVQGFIGTAQTLQELWDVKRFHGLVVGLTHLLEPIFPHLVHRLELGALCRKLTLNVLG